MNMLIEHWLELLPAGYRERALRARAGPARMSHRTEADSMHKAIGGAFEWRRTREGNHFWDHVYDHYESMEEEGYTYTPLPPLPTTNRT